MFYDNAINRIDTETEIKMLLYMTVILRPNY